MTYDIYVLIRSIAHFELSYWVVHKYEKKVAVDVKFQDLAFSVEIIILLPASRAIVLFIKTLDAVSLK